MNTRQKNDSRNSVDRRTMIKGAVTLGLGATAYLNLESLAAASGLRQEPQVQEEQQEHRLYRINLTAEERGIDMTLEPRPIFVDWSNHTTDFLKVRDMGFRFVTWATAEEAATLTKSERIESLSLVEPADVVVLGRPEDANGKLTVRLFPNAGKSQFVGGDFASTTDIVADWKQGLDNVVGIKISALGVTEEKPKGKMAEGVLPAKMPSHCGPGLEGVIVIEFEGELDETVLATITNHPQTLLIQWGEIIVREACPGCGMG